MMNRYAAWFLLDPGLMNANQGFPELKDTTWPTVSGFLFLAGGPPACGGADFTRPARFVTSSNNVGRLLICLNSLDLDKKPSCTNDATSQYSGLPCDKNDIDCINSRYLTSRSGQASRHRRRPLKSTKRLNGPQPTPTSRALPYRP